MEQVGRLSVVLAYNRLEAEVKRMKADRDKAQRQEYYTVECGSSDSRQFHKGMRSALASHIPELEQILARLKEIVED